MGREALDAVYRYLEARNRGEVRAAMRQFHPSISYQVIGLRKKEDRRKVRHLERWGKAISCRLRETNA